MGALRIFFRGGTIDTTFLLRARDGCKILWWVCRLVCPLAYIENHITELHQFCACCSRPFLYHADGVVIRCVLPVSWMTSCFHTMALRCVVYS